MFDEVTLGRVKATLQMRYRMLPLWYTIFEEYHSKGAPVVRPLFWDFLEDTDTHAGESAVEDQIMLGDTVLVHGVTQPMHDKNATMVYLPKGKGGGSFFKPSLGPYSAPSGGKGYGGGNSHKSFKAEQKVWIGNLAEGISKANPAPNEAHAVDEGIRSLSSGNGSRG